MEVNNMRSRIIPAKFLAQLPLVAIVTQCFVIMLLLLEPTRYNSCAPIVQQQCTQSDVAQKAPNSRHLKSLQREEDGGAGLKYGENGDTAIKVLQDELILSGPMITVQVPRHPKRILFNRVPKCGSSTLMDVMVQMADTHNFTFTRAKEYMRFHLDDFWMDKLIRRIKTEPTPVIYERHIHYFDSEKYGMERPVFINVIRDPLERMVSWYYFRRYQDGHERQLPIEQRVRTFDECVLGNHSECMEHGGAKAEEGFFKIIPFFCGQEEFCREPTKEALIQAIKNVKKHYLVVGVLEDFEGFIEVLEFLLPDYFQGAQEVYTKQGRDLKDRHKTTYKLPVSEQTEQIMRARLFKEYQFYMFVQKRFRRMLEAVRAAKLETMTT